MLVKSPAIKLGVEIRDAQAEESKLVLSGVANAMPCTVEISGHEMVRLFVKVLKPAVIALFIKCLFSKEKDV